MSIQGKFSAALMVVALSSPAFAGQPPVYSPSAYGGARYVNTPVRTITNASPRTVVSGGVAISDGNSAISIGASSRGRTSVGVAVGINAGETYYAPAPAPVYYAPPTQVYYAPPPAPVYYAPAPVCASPPVVVADGGYCGYSRVTYCAPPVVYCAPPVVYYSPPACSYPVRVYYGAPRFGFNLFFRGRF